MEGPGRPSVDMARLLTYGADGAFGDATPTITGTFPVSSSANIADGANGRRISGGSATARMLFDLNEPAQRRYYARAYFRASGLPSRTLYLMELGVPNVSGIFAALTLSPTGVLTLLRNNSFNHGTATIEPGVIHLLELMWMSGPTTSSGEVAARLDGELFGSASGVNCGAALTLDDLRVGITRSPGGSIGAIDLDFDGIALNDDQGSTDNSWPGPIAPPAPPNTEAIGQSTQRISRQPGADSVQLQWAADKDFTQYEVRVLADASTPREQGTLVESGGGGTADQIQTTTITDDELVAASPAEGTKLLAVFVRDAAGNWSI